MASATPLEALLRRDRAVILTAVALVVAMAWAYLVHLAVSMAGQPMDAAMTRAWTPMDFALTSVMWIVMMVAMMVPSAAPMIVMHATINRRRKQRQQPFVATAIFVLGYVLVWSGFAVLATLGQWALHQAALLPTAMSHVTPVLGGALLLLAGAYQWFPVKHACLRRCRTPLGFLMTEWRDGRKGALVMGLRHGAFCLGCCWFLMGLMFVGGVMNLLWMAAIAVYILLEKITPAARLTGRVAGLLLIAWGVWMLA